MSDIQTSVLFVLLLASRFAFLSIECRNRLPVWPYPLFQLELERAGSAKLRTDTRGALHVALIMISVAAASAPASPSHDAGVAAAHTSFTGPAWTTASCKDGSFQTPPLALTRAPQGIEVHEGFKWIRRVLSLSCQCRNFAF